MTLGSGADAARAALWESEVQAGGNGQPLTKLVRLAACAAGMRFVRSLGTLKPQTLSLGVLKPGCGVYCRRGTVCSLHALTEL